MVTRPIITTLVSIRPLVLLEIDRWRCGVILTVAFELALDEFDYTQQVILYRL